MKNYRLRSRRQPRRRYSATLLIIGINIVFYFIMLFLQLSYGEKAVYEVALQPASILQGQRIWTIITSMFMHANFIHLFVNMLSLFFLGSFLERLIGNKRFLTIYLISGIIASLFFVLLAAAFGQDLTMPAVGASGAVFGLGGVLAVLTPKVPVYILFIPIAMPLWFGIALMLCVLWIVSAAAGLPIGNTAHLGGFIAGLAYGFYLRLKYKRKVAMLDSYFKFRR